DDLDGYGIAGPEIVDAGHVIVGGFDGGPLDGDDDVVGQDAGTLSRGALVDIADESALGLLEAECTGNARAHVHHAETGVVGPVDRPVPAKFLDDTYDLVSRNGETDPDGSARFTVDGRVDPDDLAHRI